MAIELRPHHLLCRLGWRGYGYDRAFTETFNRIVERLDADAEIELVEGADDICRWCPNPAHDQCRAHLIDRRVLDYLGLEAGGIHKFGRLAELIKTKITPDELTSICEGCSWLDRGWCAEGLLGFFVYKMTERVIYHKS
jgi:hypothetical protein